MSNNTNNTDRQVNFMLFVGFKMQRDKSFSVLDDDDSTNFTLAKNTDRMDRFSKNSASHQDILRDLLSDSEEELSDEGDPFANPLPDLSPSDALSHVNGIRGKSPNAGPSGRQTIGKIKSPISHLEQHSSDSDSETSDAKGKRNNPGEYDPKEYEDLDVNEEIKDLFQFIIKYIPQNFNLDFKFKPFIPDFIPAVGDIDAFIKVKPPDDNILGEKIEADRLGLAVLDEPSANQSDPALLHLQLRATSFNAPYASNIVVKKVGDIEKNTKIIDKWIKDINDLHKSKSSPIVKYTDPMPDLDDLMEQWPEQVDNILKVQGLPDYTVCPNLKEYIDIICCIFDIPMYKNKLQSLHLLFSLYAAIKASQLYQASNILASEGDNVKNGQADQLVLD